MNTIWKYTLKSPKTDLELPKGSEVLSVGVQNEEIVLWVKVDPLQEKESRTFVGFGTGHDIPDALKLSFIGTVMLSKGKLVFHIFEQN